MEETLKQRTYEPLLSERSIAQQSHYDALAQQHRREVTHDSMCKVSGSSPQTRLHSSSILYMFLKLRGKKDLVSS